MMDPLTETRYRLIVRRSRIATVLVALSGVTLAVATNFKPIMFVTLVLIYLVGLVPLRIARARWGPPR